MLCSKVGNQVHDAIMLCTLLCSSKDATPLPVYVDGVIAYPQAALRTSLGIVTMYYKQLPHETHNLLLLLCVFELVL